MQHEEFLHRRFTSLKPKTISISAQTLAQMNVLDSEKAWPLVVEANVVGVDLAEWAAGHLQDLQARLLKTGAILFRNFEVDSIDKFKKFVHLISPELLEYNERSTPRTEVSGEIYTATEYPADDRILRKPGALSDDEFEVMKQHPAKGAAIMGGVAQLIDIIPGMKYH